MGKKDVQLPAGTTRAEGSNGEILFDGQFVTVKHKWIAKAGRGESRYPIGSVTGVEVKPGFITAIFTLVVSGGVQRGDSKDNRKGDPLSVEGSSTRHLPGFNQMRDRILEAVAARDAGPVVPAVPAPTAAGAPGLGDQLMKLGELHTQGLLSDAEFAAAKGRLLGQSGSPDQPYEAL